MSKNRYRNKIPPLTPDPEHWTRKSRSWKAKVAYETEDEAWEYLNLHPRLISEGMTAYRCKVCNKWHCGHENGHVERRCKNCVMFADADEDSAPCCLAFDTYTFAKGDDKACGRFRMRSVKF